MAEIPMVLILVGLAAYTVFGGADFGAGFWELTARGERGKQLRERTHRAMAPVWEANHVWLIFVLVMCWTCYPEAFASIASTLTIPLFLAAIGIIMRGAAYALRVGTATPREEGALSAVFALSSIITPFALGAAVGGIASGRVPVGNAAGDQFTSWLNPTSLLIGTLAVLASAYLAAVYLAADAHRMGDREFEDAFRRRALGAGVVAGAFAMAGPFVLRQDAASLYEGLTSGGGLVALVASFAAGLTALVLVARRRFEPARYSAAAAVAAIVAGWGLGQRPAFLPGMSIEQAAAGDATIVAVLIGFAVGAVLLVPSLLYLYRMVLSGRFDPAAPLAGASDPAASESGLRSPSQLPGIDVGRERLWAALLAVSAAVAFAAEGWLRGAGMAAMLAASVGLFVHLAPLDGPDRQE